MTLKHRFQVQASPVSMANPSANRLAHAMLDDPGLMKEIAYRQLCSLWAGHLRALKFWTCALGAYEDAFYARYGEKDMRGTPAHDALYLAIKRSGFSPEHELPRWMRRSPGRTFLRLPKVNPFSRVMSIAPDDLRQDDLPYLLLSLTEKAFVKFFPPSLARLSMLAEAGRTYSRLTSSSMDKTALAFGLSRSDYGAVVSDAHRFKEHGVAALSVRKYGRINPDAPEAHPAQYEKARDAFYALYAQHMDQGPETPHGTTLQTQAGSTALAAF